MTKRGTNKMPDENEPVITYSMLTPAAARRRDRRRKMARAGYAIAMTVAVVTPSPLSSVGAAVQAVADASALPITIF